MLILFAYFIQSWPIDQTYITHSLLWIGGGLLKVLLLEQSISLMTVNSDISSVSY